MKTKKTLGFFAIALAAFASVFPGKARADGDIRSIEFNGNPLGEVGVVGDLSRPLVAGDKVQFKIRLANREWLATDTDHTYLNPWQLRSLPGVSIGDRSLPQIGVRVSGGLRYADIVRIDDSADIHHTDLICQYTVQAGDFALPLKLSNSSGTAPAMEADPSEPSITPEKSNYFLTSKNLWGFFPKNPTDNNTTNAVEFYFGPEVLDLSDFPESNNYRAQEVRDYDLSGANIQIKAIDFDDTYVSNNVWRALAAGTTTATPAAPRLSVPGGASGTYTYYVWTKDPAVAEVEGGVDRTFKDVTGNLVTHKVAAVTVSANSELVPFTLRAGDASQVGKSTEVYMSDTPSNICNRAGTLLTNFTTRVVTVIAPPPPSFKVVVDPVGGIVSTSTNNYLSVATLDVELSEVWTQDVTILLNPSMKSNSGADPFTYIGMSTAMSGAEYYDGVVTSLVVKAGNTKASEGGTMLYVYANRANDDTAKGIRFTPVIDPASATATAAAAFFTGESTAATLQVNTSKPVITMPAEGQEFSNIPANTPYDFTIQVADAMWDLHGKTEDGGKYTVYIDYNGSGTYEAISNLTANASGEITFQYRYVVGGRDYNSKIYIVNQDGVSSGKEIARSYTVHVKAAKKVAITADHRPPTYCEGETAELSFTFSEPFDYSGDAFLFLEPVDDDSRNLVECSEFEYGIPISVGSTVPAYNANLYLLDGAKKTLLGYNVVVRSTDDTTDSSNIISVWGSDRLQLTVTNMPPEVVSVSMNKTPCDTSGETMPAKTAVGVQNMFEIEAWDEEIDLNNPNFRTEVKFYENSAVTFSTNLFGNPKGQEIPYTFTTGGDGVKNKIEVKVWDKDNNGQSSKLDKTFTVFVETLDAPSISLAPYNNSTYFLESDTGNTRGRIYVDLTVPPTGLGTGHITVHLDVERVAADDGNYTLPVLNTYDLEFKNNETRKSFFLSELDGTPLSSTKGFRIRASVVETTKSPDASKTWAEYYQPSSDFIIYVENEDPVIGPGVATTNATSVAMYVPYPITWTVSDNATDASQIRVQWVIGTSSEPETIEDMNGKVATKEVVFNDYGTQKVTLMVTDKDGGLDTREWFFNVTPAKTVEIYPYGPMKKGGGATTLTKRFTNAKGLGQGRVWATDATEPNAINGFVQKWSYVTTKQKTTVFARGYKYDPVTGEPDVDDGSLKPGTDFALDASGNRWTSGDYFKYADDDMKDSFFYCWLLAKSEGEASYAGEHLGGTQPEVEASDDGRQEVVLPEWDASGDMSDGQIAADLATFGPVLVEAIFSKEYLNSDNLGDINQDGIPDVFATSKTWLKGQTLVEAAGLNLDDEVPGDLQGFKGWNLDVANSQSGAAEEGDFLPSASSTGSSLIPNVVSWSTSGEAFSAFLELRGYDENLNYRMGDDGLNVNVSGKWISDPNFSKAEWIAIAHHNPACGVDLENTEDWETDVAVVSNYVLTTAKSWIPENRTDPTVDDTDEDGLPDGYEYYYWYRAAVGTINAAGKWERLEGSRFSLDNIATGEVMTSDEIAEAFNPTVAFIGKASERDTDNDGLTDLEELAMGTNPIHWDSDGDGLSDYWEIMNGMDPLDAAGDNGPTMNLDGDFMARYDTEATYAIAEIDVDGSGKFALYAFPNNGEGLINADDPADVKLADGVESLAGIAVFHYGDDKAICVPKNAGGDLKPLETTEITVADPTAVVVKSFVAKQALALIHDQVYAQFGFDPRTGWYKNGNGYVSARWDKTELGDSGRAVNTVPYSALDEYLLLKYRYETGKAGFSRDDDKALWADRKFAQVFEKGTTKPNAAGWSFSIGELEFADETPGADTDGDGVPDGWELYVGHNPNSAKAEDTADQDGDGLELAAEYAGTDSCNAYEGVEKIYANHPGISKGWYNKFFPTDPKNKDTDGDGLSDKEEGESWDATFVWGTKAVGGDGIVTAHKYTFIYGDYGDDGSTCIRGGGLNPCSVDTDGDCLPDPWEREFAGVVFTAAGQPESLTLDSGALKLIRRGDGLADGASAVSAYITAGMDGTFGYRSASSTGDAYTNPAFTDPATGTVRDYDFDHDGLQNFQEYLVQSLRHLRYDDSSTPLMGQWMPSGSAASLKFFGFLPMNVFDGEAFYATVKEAGYPATGAWNFRDLGYFAEPPHAWDPVAVKGYRVMLRPSTASGKQAIGYCSTDPRNWDTDSDGMDDYYELFHGLNPLLGEPLLNDVIAEAYVGAVSSMNNDWTGGPLAEPVYDAMKYPWMIGTPSCDADGDGLNNYEEALYANLTNPQHTHTDPTPLWMTDSSASNNTSYVSQYYRMNAEGDFSTYPWAIGDPDGFVFAFEENEGYDTDHDGIKDSEELQLTSTQMTDPLDFSDPDRRQALWFSGDKSAAVSYACRPGNSSDVNYDCFRQFTVEAWIRPEVRKEQVVLERSVAYYPNSLSNNVTKIRANFRIGLREDGRIYGMYDSSDAVESGTSGSSAFVDAKILETNVWTHVALVFDGQKLSLFVNGKKTQSVPTTLPPANGIVGVRQEPLPGGSNFPAGSGYTFYTRSALVLGAKALDANGLVLTGDSTWDSYTDYYQGSIDEVRVWDGARNDADIIADYAKAYTTADVKNLRQTVYTAWSNGATRNDNDGKEMLPAELLFHYNFKTLPGAVEAKDVMWEPSGFTAKVMDQVRVAGQAVPGDLYCGWWKALPVHSTVYQNYRWVPWVPNMVAHLPAIDGSTVDSRYWGEQLAGVCSPNDVALKNGYVFPNTMNPYSYYHDMGGNDEVFYLNRLSRLAGVYPSLFEDTYKLYMFEQKHTSLGTTDLLPLGGAFAKRCAEMWDGGAADAWTYTGDDLDANGIPDWWQLLYGMPLYGDGSWSTLVDYNGRTMTAREAYVRDLAAGRLPDGTYATAYRTKADRNYNDLPDWWESLYGLTGSSDSDGDNLSDRAEYILSELLTKKSMDVPRVDPTTMFTFGGEVPNSKWRDQVVPDYFLRIGRLYLGEMFSDHDFMEDDWEDMYAKSIVSRSLYDAWADPDDDGWSNYAECRAGTDPGTTELPAIGEYSLVQYPVPLVKAKISYNGSGTLNNPIVIQAYSEKRAFGEMPDAVWTAGKESSGTSTSSNETKKEKYIGFNPNRVMKLNLGPGSIKVNSVQFGFLDPAYYVVNVLEDGTYRYVYGSSASADWYDLRVNDRARSGSTSMGDIVDSELNILGWVNYVTGEVEIDFSKVQYPITIIRSVSQSSGNYGIAVKESRMIMDLGQSYVRVSWQCRTLDGEKSVQLYLKDADTPTETVPSYGHLREGKNTFVAFLDKDGDGVYTLGEPYGVRTGVDIGWSGTDLAIELTDTNPTIARYALTKAFAATEFDAANALTDRGANGSYYPNYGLYYPGTNAVGAISTRVRVVRTAFDDESDGANRVVFDKMVNLTAHPYFTEADILASGVVDLDWGTLIPDYTRYVGPNKSDLTKVSYRIVLGNGSVEMNEPNNSVRVAFNNAFEQGTVQTPTTPDPSCAQLVYAGNPTFRWKHDPLDGQGVRVKDYPAFQCRIYDAAGAVVWESDVEQVPVRDSAGYYKWTAPITCGMVTKFGKVFDTTNNYSWAVSMLDAKFTTFGANEVKTPFKLQTTGNANDDAGYGTIAVKVRYFGPLVEEGLSTSPSNLTNLIHVQAFTSPDFSGRPVAEGYVKDVTDIASPSNKMPVANAYIRGLEPGSYYVRAFIDTDADFEKDLWESWGYGCYVGDGTAPYQNVIRNDESVSAAAFKFTPREYVVAKNAEVPTAEIYIEDVDTDYDGLPDAWEVLRNGGLSTKGPAAGGTYLVKVNPTLGTTVASYAEPGIMGVSAEEFAVWPILSLLQDLDGTGASKRSAVSMAYASLLGMPATVTEADVKIASFSMEDGLVLTTETATSTVGGGASLASAAAPKEVTVKWELLYAPTLDAEFTVVGEPQTVKLGGADATTKTISLDAVKTSPNYSERSGFFKVRVTEIAE